MTDPAFGDGPTLRVVAAVGRALPPGAFAVQLRDKTRPLPSLRMFAAELRAITRAFGARLIVNAPRDGHIAAAREAGADGAHLPSGAGPVAVARAAFGRGAWLSVATHTDADVRRASDAGADAVLVSPVFATRALVAGAIATEKAPRGLAAITTARAAASPGVAVYALGGITVVGGRVAQCIAAGADGVAVIRAIFASADPGRDARAIHGAFLRRP